MVLWSQCIKESTKAPPLLFDVSFFGVRQPIIIDHPTSEYHGDNVLLLAEEEKTGDVSELISTEHKRQKANNRQVLLQVLQNIQFLSRQGLAFRNDNDNGNFDQLLKKVNKLTLE